MTPKFDGFPRQCICMVTLLRQVLDTDISMAVEAHRCPRASSKMNLYFFKPVDSASCSTTAHVMFHDLHGACECSATYKPTWMVLPSKLQLPEGPSPVCTPGLTCPKSGRHRRLSWNSVGKPGSKQLHHTISHLNRSIVGEHGPGSRS